MAIAHHETTRAMQTFAKRGLRGIVDGDGTPDDQVAIGKRIASGAKLTDEQIYTIHEHHSRHNGSARFNDNAGASACSSDSQCLLHGGPAGANWAKQRISKMESQMVYSDHRALSEMFDEGTDVSLELYVGKSQLEDEIFEDSDNPNFVWAPILRSGTLATRPGPGGVKKHEPLKFVAGYASDPTTEIGLQNLVDAFNDKAVEYVTIPLSHDNDLLDNTGYIKAMKIVDSKIMPNEKVLIAAHELTEPQIKEKIVRGSIPSRSCGILYDYTNPTTGKTYSQCVEHVALTHKPWVTGMARYGSDEFSSREVVPMRLSEQSKQITSKDAPTPTLEEVEQALPEKPSTRLTEEEVDKRLALADVLWDRNSSMRTRELKLIKALQTLKKSNNSSGAPWYSIADLSPDQALIHVDYGFDDPTDNDVFVVPYSTTDDGDCELADISQWKPVEQQWVNDTIDPDEDISELKTSNLSNDPDTLELAVLTAKARNSLPSSAFVFPDSREYPIHDLSHARNALARGAQNEAGDRLAKIRSAVYKKYPQLKPTDSDGSGKGPSSRKNMSETHLGGSMSQVTDEQLDRLGLSDEARELFKQQQVKLAETDSLRKMVREGKVERRIAELKAEGFSAMPGFLRTVEEILLSDDGDVAMKLTLSENGVTTQKAVTATDLVEKMIAVLPRKEGKIDFGEQGNLLESPIDVRSALTPKEEEEQRKIKAGESAGIATGDDLMSYLSENAPEYAKMELAQNRNGKKES